VITGSHRIRVWIAVLSWACATTPAQAELITLHDFDTVTATNASVGSFTIEDDSYGLTPVLGSSFGLLETSGGSTTGAVESAMGLGNNTIRQSFNKGVRQPGYSTSKNNDVDVGSAFQITFTALAGDVLEFQWNMLTDEPDRLPSADLLTYTDFGWWDLSGADSDDGALANVNDGGFGALGTTPYSEHTGPQQTQIVLTSGGTYTITVGANDVADNTMSSALMIDFFRLVRGPEPGTFGTVAGGLLALAWLSRRRPAARGRKQP